MDFGLVESESDENESDESESDESDESDESERITCTCIVMNVISS